MEFDSSILGPFIIPIALVICWVLGAVIKNCIKNETLNQYIPLILAVVGVIICAWDTMSFTPTVVAQGLVTGFASSGTYDLIKNLRSLKEVDENA